MSRPSEGEADTPHARRPPAPSVVRRFLSEPLTHFLLFGALLALALRAGEPDESPILIDDEFAQALHDDHVRRTGVDDVSIEALTDSWIRDEVLYRRALEHGLDVGDAIVRRRLIQKMELVVDASVEIPDATDAELASFLESHADTYRRAPRFAFEHRYFSADRREDPLADAQAARLRVAAGDVVDADPFLLGSTRPLTSQVAVQRRFGAGFANAVAALTPGHWSAPIQSRYGVHLVRVTERQDGETPDVESIRSELQHAWREAERAAHVEEVIARLVAEATVVRGDRPNRGEDE